MPSSAREVYEDYVKPLPPEERLRLVEWIARDMVHPYSEAGEKPKRSILELHGLGKDLWGGIDAQEYVNSLRDEWDGRP